jgi:hypothetical protein
MDIRLPIGLLFSILGVVIGVFGFATKGADIYKHSLNINVNIYTGICLLAFGLFMLMLAIRAQAKNKTQAAK